MPSPTSARQTRTAPTDPASGPAAAARPEGAHPHQVAHLQVFDMTDESVLPVHVSSPPVTETTPATAGALLSPTPSPGSHHPHSVLSPSALATAPPSMGTFSIQEITRKVVECVQMEYAKKETIYERRVRERRRFVFVVVVLLLLLMLVFCLFVGTLYAPDCRFDCRQPAFGVFARQQRPRV